MPEETGWFVPTIQFGKEDVFLFEDWEETPVGPYRAVFHFNPDDFRTLYASTPEGGDFVSSVHRFDEKNVVEVKSRRNGGRWTIEADTGDKGPLKIEIDYRETGLLKLVNPIAAYTPKAIARNALYCRLLPRIAGPMLGIDSDQKIAAETEMGRKGCFQMYRIYRVIAATCTWGDRDMGPLEDCCYDHDIGGFKLTTKPIISYLTLYLD
ncbi:MAG: hypothetical protein SWK76_05205 [Actinomycetota bacterium]|nr:hypothetical protein [Actinomycetota bacterium]